jgi:hypothetical protein
LISRGRSCISSKDCWRAAARRGSGPQVYIYAPSQSFNIFEDLSSTPKRGRPALLQVCKPTLDFPAAPVPAFDVLLDVLQVEPRSAPSQTFNIVEDLSGAQKRGEACSPTSESTDTRFSCCAVSCSRRDAGRCCNLQGKRLRELPSPIAILPIIQKLIAHRCNYSEKRSNQH